MAWFKKPYECPDCGWQGMSKPVKDATCPECGNPLVLRSWLDTWGLTLVILGVVVAAVLFVAYFGHV